MKKFLFLVGVLVSSFECALAQQPVPTPIPTTGATPVPQVTPLFPRTGRGTGAVNAMPGPVFGASPETIPDGLALRQMIVQKYAQPLYRKPTDKEMYAISPRADVAKSYAAFLQQPNTGIFRLVVDAGCAEDEKVVAAGEECMKFTMPGAGNSYSFRAGTYRVRRLADLTYSNDKFSATGILMHAVMVRLGDLPIEKISLDTRGMKYLIDFRPVTDFEKAREADAALWTGIERDGFLYGRSLVAAENAAYAMRIVAYQGKVYRSVKGAPYNELDFDKRRDVIVVFRIVDRGQDGSLTFVWRQLSSTESPKLKPPPSATAKVIAPKP